MNHPMTLAARRRGMTLTILASRLGCSRSRLYAYAAGELCPLPRVAAIEALLNAPAHRLGLNVSVSELPRCPRLTPAQAEQIAGRLDLPVRQVYVYTWRWGRIATDEDMAVIAQVRSSHAR